MQEFIQNLALFFSTFLGKHVKVCVPVEAYIDDLQMLEQKGNRENILDSHRYLLKISEVNDREVFKTCLDYWGPFVADLEEEIRKLPISDVNPMLTLSLKSSLVNGGPALNPSLLSDYPLRKHMYSDILTGLRLVMISKMVRPQEVCRSQS